MRIPFYDGEAIEQDDFNLQRELMLKVIFDQITGNMAGPDQVPWDLGTTGRRTSEMRPLRHAGAFYSNTASSVNVNGGLWLSVDYGGVFGNDAPLSLLGHKGDVEEITGFVAAAAALFRRDIIQARVVSVDDPASLRAVEDGITRAVTSQILVKRSRLTVEYQRKAGTEVASQVLADDPATEQTADAGWFKIGSVLCNDAGMMGEENYWDWRKPWGYSTAVSGADDLAWASAFAFVLGVNAEDVSGAVGNINVNCPFSKNAQGPSSVNFSAVRLEEVSLACDFVGLPAAADIRLYRYRIGTGFGTLWDNVGTRVNLTANSKYGLQISTDKPLWSNGGTNPAVNPREMCRLFIATSNAADKIHGVEWKGWGGF